MNKWALPLVSVVIIIFAILLFLAQGKFKSETPDLPPASDTFKPINLSNQHTQSQTGNQQNQTQQPQPTFGVEEGLKASYSAVIKTTKGNITVTLRADQAPNTVKNFINKAKSSYYKNLTFHRVEDWVIQGGDPQGTGAGGGQMQTEINQLPFVTGSLGVARRDNIQISNDSQFFITKSDASWLNQQYTNFGTVTAGMDVVNSMKMGDKILGITVEE